MKRRLFITLLISVCWISMASASSKSEAREEIGEAKDLLKTIEKTRKYQTFVPYRNYHDAKVYLDTAIYQYEEEGEYDEAALYAVLARVEMETVLTIAMTRHALHTRLEIEKNFYEKLASRSSRWAARKIAIVKANLLRERRRYRRILFDSVVFQRGSLTLTRKGNKILQAIVKVLKLHPRSRIKIVGHTMIKDTNNTISQRKAESIASYLKRKGIKGWRIQKMGVGSEKPMEINDRMRATDRVELIISGIR